MSQWEVAVSIYPIIHHSAVKRTLTTDTKEDAELGWRLHCLQCKLMVSFASPPSINVEHCLGRHPIIHRT